MPLTRISMRRGKPAEYHKIVMNQIYEAMKETIAIPENDRFATITEHEESCFNISGDYAEIDRSNDLIIIQIVLNEGRTIERKKALYTAIANRLADNPGIRREDVFISLQEVAKEDWSLGNGEAQYA